MTKLSKLTILIAAILLTSSVYAIGIGPPTRELFFEPGLKEDLSYLIVNSENEPMDAEVSVIGPLEQYFSIDQTTVRLGPKEPKEIFIHMKLPEKLEPGIYEMKVRVMEGIPKDAGTIIARAGVESRLKIEVPAKGKDISAYLKAESVKLGQPVKLTLQLKSTGSEGVDEISSSADIFDKNQNKVKTIPFETTSLSRAQEKEISAEWKGAEEGIYKAVAKINFDGNTKEASTNFSVGTVSIEILDLIIGKVKPDEIVKITAILKSKWDEAIKDVIVELKILDKTGAVIGKAESQRFDLAPNEEKKLDLFWEAIGIGRGTYTAKAIAHYTGKVTEKEVEFSTGKASAAPLIGIIGIIISVILIVYALFAWKRKQQPQV